MEELEVRHYDNCWCVIIYGKGNYRLIMIQFSDMYICSIDNLIDDNRLGSAFTKKCRIVIGPSRYHVRVMRFRPNKVNVASKVSFFNLFFVRYCWGCYHFILWAIIVSLIFTTSSQLFKFWDTIISCKIFMLINYLSVKGNPYSLFI